MKRLRSFGDDLDTSSAAAVVEKEKEKEKVVGKDWGRRERERERDKDRDRDRDRDRDHQDPDRSSSHRRFYSKERESGTGRKGLSSSSSFDRSVDEDRVEGSRSIRKRVDHDSDSFDRRKTYDRYRDWSDSRGVSISSPRNVFGSGGGDRMHRSDSFSGYRRDFPKGIRSERDRSRREGSVSSRREEGSLSWRRFSGSKDSDESPRYSSDLNRANNRVASEDRAANGRSPHASEDRAANGRSPQGSRDAVKSPPLSKDSSCEQSKSVEVKKNDEAQGDSGSSSEMEEGELEPEPEPEMKQDAEQEKQPKAEPGNEIPASSSAGASSSKQDSDSEPCNESEKVTESESKALPEDKLELKPEGGSDGKQESGTLEISTNVSGENGVLSGSSSIPIDRVDENKEEGEVGSACGEKEDSFSADTQSSPSPDRTPEEPLKEVTTEVLSIASSLPLEEERKEEKVPDVKVKTEGIDLVDSNNEVAEENRRPDVTLTLINVKPSLYSKDKGKSLAVSPSSEANSMGNGHWMERDLLACRDDAMEGPSSRGFELFFSPVVTRVDKASGSSLNKQRDEKLKMEPLELSLGLPNVSLPQATHDPIPAPSSPSQARSMQSYPHTLRSCSDAFTTSISFSGSQTFVHNPSCSLTQNSFENYEQSVGSHPIFQGVDRTSHGSWPGQSSYETKRKEVPLYQRILLNGNGSHHASQTPQGILNSQPVQGQPHKVSEGSTRAPVCLDRQSSLARQLSGVQSRHRDEVRSPTNSIGSHETRSEYSKDKKRLTRERSGSSLIRSNSQREFEQLVMGGTGFVERIIGNIVTDPIQVMAGRMQEMTDHSLAFLKKSVSETLLHDEKRRQLHAFQKSLQNRSEITLDMLSKCHRVQLEILVALKTGLQDFLQLPNNIPSSDLAEIFLNMKCRNLACRSLLPVDECDCKVCSQKKGFCSACMCQLCSKFDMASNTCSWVGCDVCLHWCHTDCGLRESFIRNGRSASGAHGSTEMQFHCVACGHPSEMFGFVKEVFKTCAREWKAGNFSNELEYVKRIFAASNDVRGKKLHTVADKMLPRLENKSNLPEVYNYVMGFFTESDSKAGISSTYSVKESPRKNPGERRNGAVGPSQESTWLASVPTEKVSPRVESSAGRIHPSLDWDHHQVGSSRHSGGNQELRINNAERKPVTDELESIVRIKKAEAKMFQERADDARREAEGLKRIANAKKEKIEEEYRSRITKLRLVEAEERRKQKLEELQVIERAHQEYFSMKMRMESDIKDLLLKMEAATTRN